MKSIRDIGRRGVSALTLLEMVVVLAILSAITGLLTYSLAPSRITFSSAGRDRTAAHIVTDTTVQSIFEAVLGAPGAPGYWSDMEKVNVAFPMFVAQLYVGPDQVAVSCPWTMLSANSNTVWFKSLVAFNPRTGKGWRGPYLNATGASYPFTLEATNRYFTGDLHPPALGSCPVPLDGWGNPIIIQWGTLDAAEQAAISSGLDAAQIQVKHARIISAGPNGVLDSLSPASKATLLKYDDFVTDRAPGGARLSGDDIIRFFFWPSLE